MEKEMEEFGCEEFPSDQILTLTGFPDDGSADVLKSFLIHQKQMVRWAND